MKREPLLRVEHLQKFFPARRAGLFGATGGTVKAVSDISFTLEAGETLGIVGESGCGKSTLGRTIMGLYKPTGGKVFLRGKDLNTLARSERLEMRRHYQMIFQDPYASLNPRMNVYDIIAEPLRTHGVANKGFALSTKLRELMDRVGLPASMARRYPHEFSGGQRQRIAIARAIAIKPSLIICDEPVSALDVSIQAQIINLLHELQRDLGLAYVFISHDIGVVRHVSHRVLVMYLGRVMEQAPTEQLFAGASHPYTQALLSAVPLPDPRLERQRQRIILSGDLPSPLNPPPGCLFQTRCPHAYAPCPTASPTLHEVGKDHRVACFLRG
jgi:oligopeptide/dipeptide ABC transporter ATP-binding protein